MREGIGANGSEFPLMTRASRARFVHLRDDELNAIFAFLQSR